MSDEVSSRLGEIQSRISQACQRAGRNVDSVQLIAVSKTFPAEAIESAYAVGQRSFGESRQQEAQPKIDVLSKDIDWHFIGRMQRNKVRKILASFATIHAIDSLKLAEYVSQVSAELGLVPNLFLQVNVGGEKSKGGFESEQLKAEIEKVLAVGNVNLCGLMTIPPSSDDPDKTRRWFAQLRELRDSLSVSTGAKLPSLSMGMSGDYELAIEEGATHIRVGSAIFGGRTYQVEGELGAR